MKPDKRGFFDETVVRESGLPFYSFDDRFERYIPSDYATYSELKTVFNIHLTNEERESMIVAFERTSNRQKGYAALYSLQDVINKRHDTNIQFFFPFEE